MFHDSRYGEECSHGHGWYFFEDGCAIRGCENAPEIIHIDNEGVVRKSTVLRDPEPECTGKIPFGVPEQGPQVYPDLTSEQIEEIARTLDEPQLKRLHGGILALSLRYVAAVQEAPRAIRQLRAALERPLPALPPDARITEPRGCPTPGACSCVGAETDALTVVLRDLANGIATALRDNRPVDNDLRYSLIWQSLERHGWNTLGVRPALPEAHGPECPQRPPRLVHELTGEPVLPCDCGAALPAEHAPPDPKIAELVQRLREQCQWKTEMPCERDPMESRCVSCRAADALETFAASLRAPQSGPGLNLSAVNLARCTAPDGFNHPLASWSAAEWTNAVAGEAGEACNLAKKLIRHRDGVPGNKKPEDLDQDSLRRRIAEELADVVIYCDLAMASVGYDFATTVRDVFNRKSQELGSPYAVAGSGAEPPPQPEIPK